ncbi:unnamed protein product [Brassica rapa subsp. trilocularis]|uniref:Uncharacterized protein n=1 Tax=Brassica campestris TaxID=3711 RepID=A0A3P6D8V7_BRACM|nr:unnamed protein product [Brassica rapa]
MRWLSSWVYRSAFFGCEWSVAGSWFIHGVVESSDQCVDS